MTFGQEIIKGLWRENPTLVLVLGTCPTLAVTTKAANGIGMGLATTFVLLCSNVLIALVRGIVPDRVRIPVFIVIIATFVTVVDMVMSAYFRALYTALGLFIPLIVVNCIILGRAEAFASRHGVWPSIADALGMGLGFTLALVAMGSLREILGNGTFFGMPLMGKAYVPILVMILPPGGFFTFGLLTAVFVSIGRRNARKMEEDRWQH